MQQNSAFLTKDVGKGKNVEKLESKYGALFYLCAFGNNPSVLQFPHLQMGMLIVSVLNSYCHDQRS
jgi:hypothetical protein